MKFVYLASMYDDETYKKIFVNKSKPIQAAGKYHKLMCEGIVTNDVALKTIAILPINSSNCSKKIIQEKPVISNGVKYEYIKCYNLPILKQISYFLQSKRCVVKEDNTTYLIVDFLNSFSAMGAIKAAKKRNLQVVGIVTDLPDFLSRSNKFVRLISSKIMKYNLSHCDKFVFLTYQMNEKVNEHNKPFIVLEGHSDINMKNENKGCSSGDKKKILYAGTLDKKYGVLDLCYAFKNISKIDEELHIYGDGDSKEDIERLSNENRNIIYHGVVPNDEVVAAEINAKLLVNPRQPREEFTKYSFPSKIMEYMSTGTPVLMYKLPGIPDEYFDYVFLVDNTGNPEKDIGNSIRRIFDSNIDLADFGNNAKNFVLSEKNNVVQAKKLIDFLAKT